MKAGADYTRTEVSGKFYGCQKTNFFKIACTELIKILNIIIINFFKRSPFGIKKFFKDPVSTPEDLVSIKKISCRI